MKTDKFIALVNRYTDFSELTTPMLNEFIEKVIVYDGQGRGNNRRQRIDIYLNFIGAFEVPAHIVTPMEAEEQRRQQGAQKANQKAEKRKEAEPPKLPKPKSLKELAALQRAGAILTSEETARLAAYREKKSRQHKAWYERQKAARPPKPRTLKEIAAAQSAG